MTKVLLWQNRGERNKNCGKNICKLFELPRFCFVLSLKSLYTFHTLCYRNFQNFVHLFHRSYFHHFSLSIQDSVLSPSLCPQLK
ncbi:hypothetical protein GIB67_021324 [Kingdonia uniflora]|uniref:Uncharacterized protein n=1 Tax=Kingdonia uniflora TaxID=39325 RepID=A0A7J7LY89_9MAGN|nr:hypothetical protein GIB67_021324 [Kingdonia uniflora]